MNKSGVMWGFLFVKKKTTKYCHLNRWHLKSCFSTLVKVVKTVTHLRITQPMATTLLRLLIASVAPPGGQKCKFWFKCISCY